MSAAFQQVIEEAVQSVLQGYDARKAWWPIRDALRNEPHLDIPKDAEGQRVFGISSSHVSMWLLERALEVGAQQSIAELVVFLERPRRASLPAIVLDELCFASTDECESFAFSNGIVLSAVSHLDNYRIDADQLLGLEIILHPKLHGKIENTVYIEAARDVMRCLSLVRPPDEAVSPAYETEIWDKSAPRSYDRLRRSFLIRGSNLASPLLSAEIQWAESYLRKLTALHGSQMVHARRILDRWISANSSASLADKAIDIRIILEALFVTGKGDNTHKVSRRGALMLGGSVSERVRNLAILKSAYDTGSRVVHGMALVEKHYEAITTVRPILKRCIQKWIGCGAPLLLEEEWETIEMGGDYPQPILKASDDRHLGL